MKKSRYTDTRGLHGLRDQWDLLPLSAGTVGREH